MYVKIKSYFLKPQVCPEELKRRNFGEYFTRDIDNVSWVVYYKETGRLAVRRVVRETAARKVRKYITDLIEDGLVEIRPIWEWWAIIGRWQNYDDDKKAKIEAELNKRNKELKYYGKKRKHSA